MRFNLAESLKAHGVNVVSVGAYEKKNLRLALKTALTDAKQGAFTTIVVTNGACIQKLSASTSAVRRAKPL